MRIMGSSPQIYNLNKKYKSVIKDLDNITDLNCKIDALKQCIKFDLRKESDTIYNIGALRLFLNPNNFFVYFDVNESSTQNLSSCIQELIKDFKSFSYYPSSSFIYFNLQQEFFCDLQTTLLFFNLFDIANQIKKTQNAYIYLFFSINFENLVGNILKNYLKSFGMNTHFEDIDRVFNLIKSNTKKEQSYPQNFVKMLHGNIS